MTVANTLRKAGPMSGNGVTTAFPFTFKVFAGTDVQVVEFDVATNVETIKTITTHYTVSLNSDQDVNPGGTVNYLVAPATGKQVTLLSAIPALQDTDLVGGGGFYPQTIENSLDRLTALIQQLQELQSRSMLLPVSFNLTALLPTPTPFNLLGWDGSGSELVNYDPGSVGGGGGGGGVSDPATYRYINIRNYQGLVTGGSWTAAFNQALVDAAASDKRVIYFPYDVTDNNGNYNFNSKPNAMGRGILLVGENPRQFLVRNYAPSGAAATEASSFLIWNGADYNGSDPNQNKGGGMLNLGVGAGNGTTDGTAILVTGADTNFRPGYMLFQNIVVSVPLGSTGTWGFGALVKGAGVTTTGSQGMRDITFLALYLFRCTSDPMQITNGVHVHVHGLTVSDGGAGNPNPTVRVNGGGSGISNSTQCVLNNLDIEGTLHFQDCNKIVAMGYVNVISSAASATQCKFIGHANTNSTVAGTTVV